MAELGSFLGHLLQEITRARVLADMEAVRTAKHYAADPDGLLRHFAVPRVRLPDIEITAPMVVSMVPDGHQERADPDLLSRSVAADLVKVLVEQKIKFGTSEIVSVIKSNPALARGEVSSSSAEALSAAIGEKIRALPAGVRTPAEVHAEVVALIRKQIGLTLQNLPLSPVGIEIDARTSAVKEFHAADSGFDSILYVKMSITEEALEIEFHQPAAPVPPGQPAPAPVIKRLSPE